MLYLFLIRHGETPWTREKRFQGSTNTSLNARGIRQAEAVAKTLKKYKVDTIYASPLNRARQTAEKIKKSVKRKIVYDRRLRELGFGKWEGKTSAELLGDLKSGYHAWCKGKPVTPPKGEKLTAFRKRVASFLKDLSKKHSKKPGQKIAVVTHGGPVKMILYEALRLPFRSLWSFRIETTSVTILGIGEHYAQVFCLNDTSHLPRHLAPQPEYLA